MGKFTEFKIPLKTLSEGSHKMEFKIDKGFFVNMENNDIHDADIDVVLEIKHHNGMYELDFHITGKVIVLCDRCLDDLEFPIDTIYHIYVKYGDKFNDDGDELLEIPQSDNFLNVAYMIYDTIALAIPIKHVHPLGKCNRQMSALLKKHRAESNSDDADDLDFIDGADLEGDEGIEETQPKADNDPRWDALKNIGK